MAPIRVGLIGLSGAPPSEYEGTNWALSAHLPYLLASPHYTITALLNRSISSARAAIERYNLPSDTKAYGDPVGKSPVLFTFLLFERGQNCKTHR